MADEQQPPAVPDPLPPSTGAEQPYQSLYRRYRPQRFDEVRGQEHVTRALRNAVRDGKVAHAYLFSGPRGTGKTSTARILAMALNCESPVDGEPDGTCPSCVEIRRGASMDVHELDAASNRKLDEMRDLLSRVALGTPGRWKVYIVDEVHQLTSDAASALLKTLEEPPGHVVFVLATTDPQKVLPTIRSRTQHFEFRLLGADVLASLLSDVNGWAALGLPPEAIDLVVRRGHGSARDALSVLDQVSAAGAVEDEAGVVTGIVEGLADRDPGAVLTSVAEAMSAGRDPRRLAVDLLEHLRNGFLATQARSLVLLPDDAVVGVEEQARRLGLAGVVKAMEVVGQAAVDMREAVDPRVTLEAALVRVAAPEATGEIGALLHRIEALERQVADLAVPTASAEAPLRRLEAPTAGAPRETPPTRDGPLRPRSLGAPPPMPGRRAEATGAAVAGAAVAGAAVAGAPVAGAPVAGAPVAGVSGVAPRPAASLPRAALGAHRVTPAGTADPAVAKGPAPAGSAPTTPAGAAPGAGQRPTRSAQGATDRPPPSREELTKAWGDHVLPGLRAGVKAYISSGRFVASPDGAAVYAVADQGLLSRARPLQPEIEAALAGHFGRPVPLRLIVDGEAPPALPARGPSGPALDPEQSDDDPFEDVDDLQDAGPAVTSPEQRLLEAFPGAEEVTP